MNNNYSIGSGSIGGSTFYPEDDQPVTSKPQNEPIPVGTQSVPEFVYDPQTSVPEFLNYDTTDVSQNTITSSVPKEKDLEIKSNVVQTEVNSEQKIVIENSTIENSITPFSNSNERILADTYPKSYTQSSEPIVTEYIEPIPTQNYIEAQSYLEPIEINSQSNFVNTTSENFSISNSQDLTKPQHSQTISKSNFNFSKLISNITIISLILILIVGLIGAVFIAYPQYSEKKRLKIARSEISSFEEDYTEIRQNVARLYQASESEYALDINPDNKLVFSAASNFYWDQINNLSESLIIKLDQFISDLNYFKENYQDLGVDAFSQRVLIIENNLKANYDFVSIQRILSREMTNNFKKLNALSLDLKDKNLTEQVTKIRSFKTELLKSKIDVNSNFNKYTFLEHKEINNYLDNLYDFWIKKCDDMVNALIIQNVELYNSTLKSIEIKHDEDTRIQSNRIYYARLNDYLNKDDNNESLEIIFDKINTRYNNNFIPEFLL